MSEDVYNNSGGNLSITLSELFNSVIKERGDYYQHNHIPTQADVGKIIDDYAVKNMLISGGASLVPGPWGLIAVLPEIALVINNQLKMIYDIGVANGKKDLLDKDLLVIVFATAVCTGGIAYITISGGRVMVKRVSLRVFQQIIEMTAGKITQRLIKSAVSKWIPLVGAAVMAGWSYHSTYEIGRKAVMIMEKPFDYTDDHDRGDVACPAIV